MPVPFTTTWVPNGPFGIVNDTDVAGGFHVVADQTERENIVLGRQKVGMRVYQVDTGIMYRLTATGAVPNTNWTAVQEGGHWVVVANETERFNIPQSLQTAGMIVYQVDTGRAWRLLTPGAPPLTADDWNIYPENHNHTRFGYGILNGGDIENEYGAADFDATTFPGFNDLQIDQGVLYTGLAQRIAPTSPTLLTNIAAGVHVVFMNASTGQIEVTSYNAGNVGLQEYNVPLFVIESAGLGVEITILEDVRPRAVQNWDKDKVTVGQRTVNGSGAMFENLRAAVFYIGCFHRDFDRNPKKIVILEDSPIQSAYGDTIDLQNDPALSLVAADKLDGLFIDGLGTQESTTQPILSWNATTGAAFVFPNSGSCANWRINDVSFSYSAAGVQLAAGLFRNSRGLQLRNSQITGSNDLGYICRWDVIIDIGSLEPTVSRIMPMVFENVRIEQHVASLTSAPFQFFDQQSGDFFLKNVLYNNDQNVNYIFDMDSLCTVNIHAEGCTFRRAQTALIRHDGNAYEQAKKDFYDCTFVVVGNFAPLIEATNDADNRKVNFFNCKFTRPAGDTGSWQFRGAWQMVGCVLLEGTTAAFSGQEVVVGGDYVTYGGGGGDPAMMFGAISKFGVDSYAHAYMQTSQADLGDALNDARPFIHLESKHGTEADKFIEALYMELKSDGIWRLKADSTTSVTGLGFQAYSATGTGGEFRDVLRMTKTDNSEFSSVEFGEGPSYPTQDFFAIGDLNANNYFSFGNVQSLSTLGAYVFRWDSDLVVDNWTQQAVFTVWAEVGAGGNEADQLAMLAFNDGVNAAPFLYFRENFSTRVGTEGETYTGTFPDDKTIYDRVGYHAIKVAISHHASPFRLIKWLRAYDTP